MSEFAKIEVSPELDLQGLAKSAGSTGGENTYYEGGFLFVKDVTQAALDAALGAFDPLKSIRARVWEAIKAERERRKAGGVKIGDKWFHSDDASRIQQLALVMMGAGLPAGLQWKMMDGSFVAMTPALAQQVFTGRAAIDQTIFAVAEAHRVAMEASADPAAYDYSHGWPKVFGEA